MEDLQTHGRRWYQRTLLVRSISLGVNRLGQKLCLWAVLIYQLNLGGLRMLDRALQVVPRIV